jgi:N-carbamoyl-L-amino-acid hydrolase
VTYLTDAHRACAAQLAAMLALGSTKRTSMRWATWWAAITATRLMPTLLTGSHYDTVRNAGKYDGRLGIFVPLAAVRELHRQGRRLPFNLEVIGFAEEEGQRYKAIPGSGALTGDFKPWLAQKDADGITMREACSSRADGTPCRPAARPGYLGFVEVHRTRAVSTSRFAAGHRHLINASVLSAMAAWPATRAPMDRRRDAACAAELALYAESAPRRRRLGRPSACRCPRFHQRGARRCKFSLTCARAGQRDAGADISRMTAICERRGVRRWKNQAAAAAPSARPGNALGSCLCRWVCRATACPAAPATTP